MINGLLPHAAPAPQSPVPRHRTESDASFSELLGARPTEKEMALDHATVGIGIDPAERRLPDHEGSILLTWGLIANGPLSQCDAITATANRPMSPYWSPVSAHTSPLQDFAGPIAPPAPSVRSAASPAVIRGEFAQPLLPPTAAQGSDAGGSLRAAPVSAAVDWLARLVRWLEQNGQGSVLWIRDYRLGDTEMRQLVNSLRLSAQEQGVSLARVVINGKELWSAKAATQQRGIGDAS